MGKKLIIKGADFSANGMVEPTPIDITSLFTTWESGTIDSSGNNKTSAVYKRSNAVDISQYQGQKLRFTNSAYESAVGLQPAFYSVFFDENDDLITDANVRVHDSGQASKGYTVIDTVDIPATAVTFKATYFDESASISFDFDDFSCIVVLDD